MTDDATRSHDDDWSWGLERLRELTGRTQQEVAAGTGLGRVTISRMENNRRDARGTHSVAPLVALYRYFWRQGKFPLDGEDAPPRRVTLSDILLVPGLTPCPVARPNPLLHIRPVRGLEGVWWNIRPLRLELNTRSGRSRLVIKDLAAALGQTPQNLSEVEGGGSTGSIELLVRAARFFAEHLRPTICLQDVLIIVPRLPTPAETHVSAD